MSDPSEINDLIACKVRALMAGYVARYKSTEADYQPVAVERTIIADLMNPATQARSRTFRVAGKLDLTQLYHEKQVVVDHKTTSDEIADPAGTYWRQLVVESQPSHYMLLLWLVGEKTDYATWDVMRKPSISPRQFKSKAEKALIVANRQYCSHAVSDETLAYLQTNDRENLELYEYRLMDDCTKVRPEWYFQRRTIPRLDSELLEYASDLWDAGQLIIEARRMNRFPKHPGACMSYGRACPFLGICSNYDRPDSDKWTVKSQVHSELELDGDGRDVLTFSSIRTFQICPRRYYYRYQMGIERNEPEEIEPLIFGHAWHSALEAMNRELIACTQKERMNEHSTK